MASDCLAETTHCIIIIIAQLIVHHCTYHYESLPARGFFTVILSSAKIREEILLIMGIISSFIVHTEQWNRLFRSTS